MKIFSNDIQQVELSDNIAEIGKHAIDYLTKEAMYRKYPHKWLLVSNPEQRESDGEIIAGELIGVFDDRELAGMEAVKLKIKSRAIINSIQEEL